MKKILANIKVANNDNSKIYSHVRRITLSSSGTIEILDPEIIVKFNNVSNELKVTVVLAVLLSFSLSFSFFVIVLIVVIDFVFCRIS